jgi:hypothetical protein
MGECSMMHVRSEYNPVDIYTKVAPAGQNCLMTLTTLVIDGYVIIFLAKKVYGSLGVSLLPIGRETTYIIMWRSL